MAGSPTNRNISTDTCIQKPKFNQDQVFTYWQHINESVCWLVDDQVELAQKVLESVDGKVVKLISIVEETRIQTLAFAFKEVLDGFSGERSWR